MYLYCDGDKSRGRDRYLVVSVNGAWCQVRKFISSQLRSTSYRVKKTECYKVPTNVSPSLSHSLGSARFEANDDEDPPLPSPSSPSIPEISRAPASHQYQIMEQLLPPAPPPVSTALSTPPD